MNIRVLHFLDFMGTGGIEILLRSIYLEIDHSECSFDVVYHNIPQGFSGDKIQFWDERSKAPGFFLYNFSQYRKWWKDYFSRHGKYDIIHIHDFFDPIFVIHDIFTACNPDVKILFHAHSLRTDKHTIYSLWRAFLSFPVRFLGDFYFGCSVAAIKDHFGKRISESRKSTVLNCGIDTSRFRFCEETRMSIRNEMKTGHGFVVGNVARFSKNKNHVFLIDVFKELHSIIPYSQLWLLGEGELMDEIKEKVEKYGLSECVKFIGFVSNPEKYFMGMDVFVLPSLNEGLGIVLIEAQSTGLLCVGSNWIQPEADMKCNLLLRIDLRESPRLWAEQIAKCVNISRIDHSDDVKKNGYDMHDIATSLINFYSKAKTSREELIWSTD